MEQDKKDWDLHPENYRTENDDGITFILKKDGTPKKKAGRVPLRYRQTGKW